MNSRDFLTEDIDISGLCVHYGHGSWKPAGFVAKMTPDEFFEINWECWK